MSFNIYKTFEDYKNSSSYNGDALPPENNQQDDRSNNNNNNYAQNTNLLFNKHLRSPQ